MLLAAPANAQVWSESDVVRLAAGRPAEVRTALAQAEIARARADTEGLHPNPWIDYERQEAVLPIAQIQDLVRIIVPLDLSGRRDARRNLAEIEAAVTLGEAGMARAEAVRGALVVFYEALAAERVLRSHEETQRAIDEARRVVAAREAAGEAAGYATARLALEAELARSVLEEARVDAVARRALLAATLGAETPERLSGTLSVDAVPELAALVREASLHRPEITALRSAEHAAERAESAAEWAWIPRVDLFAGYNRQQGNDPTNVGHGYTFRVAVEIPIFDHGQRERAEAHATRVAISEQRTLMEERVVAEVRAEHARLTSLVAERRRFDAAVAEPLEVLARSALSGYREGERSVTELVDAQRALSDTRQRAIALDLAARRAEVALRRASGELR